MHSALAICSLSRPPQYFARTLAGAHNRTDILLICTSPATWLTRKSRIEINHFWLKCTEFIQQGKKLKSWLEDLIV